MHDTINIHVRGFARKQMDELKHFIAHNFQQQENLIMALKDQIVEIAAMKEQLDAILAAEHDESEKIDAVLAFLAQEVSAIVALQEQVDLLVADIPEVAALLSAKPDLASALDDIRAKTAAIVAVLPAPAPQPEPTPEPGPAGDGTSE